MAIGKLTKSNKKIVNNVLGIDVSTNSFAYCLFDHTGPVKWGEVNFTGANTWERLADGQEKVRAIRDDIKSDLYVVEGAVYVQNKKTVILLSHAIGAVMSVLVGAGGSADEISPMTWQNAIGNKAFTKDQKAAVQKANPGKSVSWYSSQYRKMRKQITMDYVKDKYNITVPNDNQSDAIALASVAYEKFKS
jgi:Holliday junction resolvasome RuvABC endonuclease subunit